MKRYVVAAILAASGIFGALSCQAHDDGGGGGGGGGGNGGNGGALKIRPFVKDGKGAGAASGYVNYKKRRVLGLRDVGKSDQVYAGARVLNLPSDLSGEGFKLEFDINPSFVIDEFAPYFLVHAETELGDEYDRYFYPFIGSHTVFEKASHKPVITTTSDGWQHYSFGHHGCYDANNNPSSVGHHDHIHEITLFFNYNGSSGQNSALLDNIAINGVIAAEK